MTLTEVIQSWADEVCQEHCPVKIYRGEGSVIFELYPTQEKIRHIIGTKGRTIEALRLVVNVAWGTADYKIVISIMEPGRQPRGDAQSQAV